MHQAVTETDGRRHRRKSAGPKLVFQKILFDDKRLRKNVLDAHEQRERQQDMGDDAFAPAGKGEQAQQQAEKHPRHKKNSPAQGWLHT